jgi:hypothetical protein
VRALRDQGVREVVLLGQTVNSYWDRATPSSPEWRRQLPLLRGRGEGQGGGGDYEVAEGFTQRSKPRPGKAKGQVQGQGQSQGQGQGQFEGQGQEQTQSEEQEHNPDTDPDPDTDPAFDPEGGVRFAELLSLVAAIDPLNMRVRFQSPHPKDFPDEVLRLIARTPNICNSLHMPAQHGSTAVLERMHRGYTREAYVALVRRARTIIAPDAHVAPETVSAAAHDTPAATAGDGSSTSAGSAAAALSSKSSPHPQSHPPLPHGIGLGLSSDFIAGFCGETEEEHQEHLSLLTEVRAAGVLWVCNACIVGVVCVRVCLGCV